MPVAVIILIGVLLVIALRNIINLAMPIWAIMLAGAVLSLILRQITLLNAIHAIEPDIMLYLFGVFVISEAAESSGYLQQITDQIFTHANTGKQALFIIIFILGLSAALLMNDTIAIVGVPIILQLCKCNKNLVKPLLLALAYAITIGSVLSPIGNPQNLLVAVAGHLTSPFSSFMRALAIPTLINLLLTYLVIVSCYRKCLSNPIPKIADMPLADPRTARLVKISLIIMLVLIIAKIINDELQLVHHIHFCFIAIIAALPIILFSQKRKRIIQRLDWGTLLFFIGTFILIQSVWDSGFLQNVITQAKINVQHTSAILSISVLLSQFISNVPLVTLYLPLLQTYSGAEHHLLALAAGSTIAGNLTIMGAASNIIIIQNVEKRGELSFSFFDFIKIGLPLTLLNIFIYALFL
jgi:Na+/H+ antiporter NhaD/arsenite permease-like protein